MVTILSDGFTSPSRSEQERCTSSLIWTEHAPHCATPQPYLVPVRPTCSRITHRRGVSGSACTSRTLPLMLSLAMGVLSRIALAANLVGEKSFRRRAGRLQDNRGKRRRPEHSATGNGLPTGVLPPRRQASRDETTPVVGAMCTASAIKNPACLATGRAKSRPLIARLCSLHAGGGTAVATATAGRSAGHDGGAIEVELLFDRERLDLREVNPLLRDRIRRKGERNHGRKRDPHNR